MPDVYFGWRENCGLVCLDRWGWSLHLGVHPRDWQWGHADDGWYDGPILSWGLGPLALLLYSAAAEMRDPPPWAAYRVTSGTATGYRFPHRGRWRGWCAVVLPGQHGEPWHSTHTLALAWRRLCVSMSVGTPLERPRMEPAAGGGYRAAIGPVAVSGCLLPDIADKAEPAR